MLPSLVARAIEQGLESYIRNEFPVTPAAGFKTKKGESILEAFLAEPDALTKGPWAEVRLPFRQVTHKALPSENFNTLAELKGFRPYAHQTKAFERLYWPHAKSTIVATGTGSGKTECFLYPIIDYCLSEKVMEGPASAPAIKAIIIYPMNALASDQSRRIETLLKKIHEKTGIKIRAGIYTGDTAKIPLGDANLAQMAYVDQSRESIRSAPPDILLTNYRMLDFLLMRPEDQSLWEGNGPGILRYLVVDELHTFDGAQGTDLAVLIRRLKDRLGLGDSLACVGTSATIGGQDALTELCAYASDVFATNFTPQDVIEEDRLSVKEYLESFGDVIPEGHWPSRTIVDAQKASSVEDYFSKVVTAWFDDNLGFNGISEITLEAKRELGRHLPRLAGFRRFITDIQGVTELKSLVDQWCQIDEIREIFRYSPEQIQAYLTAVLDSLVAMIAMARNEAGFPFLTVRSQLWVRTLSNVVASVNEFPQMKLARDVASLSDPLHLPIIGCRECNHIAWGAFVRGGIHAGQANIHADLPAFYSGWFAEHQDTMLFYPIDEAGDLAVPLHELYRLCPACGELKSLASSTREDFKNRKEELHTCGCGSKDGVIVRVPDMTRTGVTKEGAVYTAFKNVCPYCGADNGLRIFGAAASTLSANVIDQLHSSIYNDDDKVIAFSDSVQDAALRAGFMNARNFLPTCRHAIVTYLDEKKTDNLRDFLCRLPVFWEQKFSEIAEKEFSAKVTLSAEEQQVLAAAGFLSTFIAPDKEWMNGWRAFSKASANSAAILASADAKDKDAAKKAVKCLSDSFDNWKRLYNDMRERLVWEGLMEVGRRSGNGRTLERTRAAVTYPNPDTVKAVAAELPIRLKEGIGASIAPDDAIHLITGLLNGMRLAGAFSVRGFKNLGCRQLERTFGDYLKTGNSFVTFNMSTILPTFHRSAQAPSAVTLYASRSHADTFNISLLSSTTRHSWFENWVKRYFDEKITAKSQLPDLFRILMKALEDHKLVECIARKDDTAWVLSMEQLNVSRDVSAWKCNCCGRRFFSGNGETHALWKGMPCLSENCSGVLVEENKLRENAYLAEPVRIHAREHTSLISATDRAEIEASFGKTKFPWSINLLSATSTLEMGIDIGDLSTVLLASMPPTQASYLQRIGRAGRYDGNALAVTMVDKRPHDQYFWQSPKEMLEGDVLTPGVFLQAVSVLERQLVAFALGHWVVEAVRAAAGSRAAVHAIVPRHLYDAIMALRYQKEGCFPLNFLEWTEANAERLAQSFIQTFVRADGTNALAREEQESLKRFIEGSGNMLNALRTKQDILEALEREAKERQGDLRPGLAVRLLIVLQRASEQYKRLQGRIWKLNETLDEVKKRPDDEKKRFEIEDLEQEIAKFERLRDKNFKEKSLFNFMTDEGLLPNYAFPEEGITVNSIVIKHRDRLDKAEESNATEPSLFGDTEPKPQTSKKPPVDTFDFKRAAAQAIHELAPGSRFYANQYILRVDQIALDDHSFEKWRFCSECAHTERVDLSKPLPVKCPHCSNPLFGDIGRVRTMLRANEVMAVADCRRDRIDDRKEERDMEPLVRKVMIDVREKDVESAWQVDDTRYHFGFEFLRRATVREVNFGPSPLREQGATFRAAGENYPNTGFQICRECGKVRRKEYQLGERVHDWGCSWNNKLETPDDSPWIDGFFLYREVESEAIRIRIPVCDMLDVAAADGSTMSFVAALRLGLRRHFHGAVEHLALTLASGPITEIGPGVAGRKRYVILYDTIPGGSGYLKELGRTNAETQRPEAMLKLFQEALEAVRNCECAKDPDKDGCYKCVYQYRDFKNRAMISRREAEDILQKICEFDAEHYKSIKSVDNIPPLIASALEARMLKRLSKIENATLNSRPAKNGELVHELSIALSPEALKHWKQVVGDEFEGSSMTWLIRTQVNTPGTVSSRPDFTIVPLSEGLAKRFPQLHGQIFTDGWTFHAGSLGDDTQKRQALLNKGERVWTLTWEDLKEKGDSSQGNVPQTAGNMLMRPYGEDFAKEFSAQLFPATQGERSAYEDAKALLNDKLSSLDWLIAWLKDPFGFERSMRAAMRCAALTCSMQGGPDAGEGSAYPRALQVAQPQDTEEHIWFMDSNSALPFTYAATVVNEKANNRIFVSAAIRIDDEPFTKAAQAKGKALTPALQKTWSEFWQSANALQFLDRAWVMARSVEETGEYATFYQPSKKTVPPSGTCGYTTSADTALWQEFVDELASDEEFFCHLLPLAQKLAGMGVPAPNDIVDGGPGIICSDGQGLVWKGKVKDERGVYLFAQEDLIPAFLKNRAANAYLDAVGLEAFTRGAQPFVILSTREPDWEGRLERALAALSAK